MPSTLTYPGVYIEEKSSGVHTITGVATSIAAFIGYTATGPDNTATRIFSFPDYARTFGGITADSEVSYAVQQFFQNGGSDAYIVRVPKNGATAATVKLLDAVSGGTISFMIHARSTGTWSQGLIVDVDYANVTDTAKGFNLYITDLVSGNAETFLDLTMDNTKANFVVTVINDPDNGSALITIDTTSTNIGSNRPAETGLSGGDLGTVLNDNDYTIKLTVDNPANTVDVTFIKKDDPIPESVVAVAAQFERTATASLASVLTGARVRCTPNTSGKGLRVRLLVPNAYDAQVTFAAGATHDADTFLKLSAGNAGSNVSHHWPYTHRGADVFAQAGAVAGGDGSGFSATHLVGNPGTFTGIYALEKVDLFDILCIPDATRAKASDPAKSDLTFPTDHNTIFSAARDYCFSRRAFLIIDPPPEINTAAKAVDWMSLKLTVHDPLGYAAAYFPRLKLPDPANNMQLRSFAPCGVVAGVYARTDAQRGVWKAPAGVEATLNGVQGVVYSLTDNEHGALNPLGLNCHRIFPVYGPVMWGARTIAGADALASEWKYIPVRRFALFLEESLFRGTKWVVFEPNDEPLWSQIRLNLGAFMHTLFLQGAFQGNTPQKAYFVKCDGETTTQNDINNGVVNILVGFAPLKPAEFVVIQIQQIAGQIQT
jgi:phage tail sheath protein FI